MPVPNVNPVQATLREAMELLEECNFFEGMHDAYDRQSRATKDDEVGARELLHVKHGILDDILDRLRMQGGK